METALVKKISQRFIQLTLSFKALKNVISEQEY